MGNFVIIAIILLVVYLAFKKTNLFSNNNPFNIQKKYYTEDDAYNAKKVEQKKEIDRILEKISNKGIGSLSKNEKKMLDEFSKK
ncbi:MAG: rhomboid family protein [Flavobacterium sp.]|nr:rhomboid family protein [Flavobacterium sp.]